jgi:hypothetical protein
MLGACCETPRGRAWVVEEEGHDLVAGDGQLMLMLGAKEAAQAERKTSVGHVSGDRRLQTKSRWRAMTASAIALIVEREASMAAKSQSMA